MKARVTISIAIFIISLELKAEGSETKNPTYLGVKSHIGFIIPHSQDLKEISNTNPWGVQIDASKFFIGEKSWETCNCYSKAGFSFTYFNYQNPSVLGNSYNLIFFVEPQFGFNHKFYLSYRAGFGLAFLDQVYHETENPTNLFYSSPISFMLLMNLGLNYKVDPNWQINLSAFYNHISNGGIQMPNKGINFPTLALGVDYVIDPVTEPLPKRLKSLKVDRSLKKYFRLFGTTKTVDADEIHPDKKTIVWGWAAGVMQNFTKTNAWTLGVEFSRDGSFEEKNARFGTTFDPYVFALLGGHNFTFGKVIFNQELGVYIYKDFPFTTDGVYQRYGLYYQIAGPLNAGISLKAHGATAEIIDVRVGLLF